MNKVEFKSQEELKLFTDNYCVVYENRPKGLPRISAHQP